jgi:hypothetical protein
MNQLKIPPCPHRSIDGSRWPTHKARARSKAFNRRRVIAALPQEDNRGTGYCI